MYGSFAPLGMVRSMTRPSTTSCIVRPLCTDPRKGFGGNLRGYTTGTRDSQRRTTLANAANGREPENTGLLAAANASQRPRNRPLKAVAAVRIRSGLHRFNPRNSGVRPSWVELSNIIPTVGHAEPTRPGASDLTWHPATVHPRASDA